MVKKKNGAPRVHSTYYLRSGQTLGSTKPSERALALVVPKSVYEGFYEKAHESERVALLAEREAKRLAALKEATYNMSKTWEDTAQNIQKRRREELLNRRKVEEAERIKFTKEMAMKNAEERAKVVRQAKELLLQRKPQCRLINSALFAAECYKGRSEQLELLESLKSARKKAEAEEARLIMKDVELFRKEEAKKHEERLNKLIRHKRELEKQIRENERNLKNIEESRREREIEDVTNMRKEIEEINNKELRQSLEKKKRLNDMFLDAINERKRHELKIKQEEEFQEKSLQLHRDFILQIEKIAKEKAKIDEAKKIRKAETLGKKFAEIAGKKHRVTEKEDEEEIDKEIEEKNKRKLAELLEQKQEKKERARLKLQEEITKHEEELKVEKKEEMDLKLWETLQRYKRDEFNRKWDLKKLEEERKSKINYGKILKMQMQDNDEKRKKAAIENDDSALIKEMIDNENKKILSFGEKVLEESQGVLPIYPIAKTLEEFKREMGLVPLLKTEEDYEVGSVPKKKQGRRTFCQSIKEEEEETFHFA